MITTEQAREYFDYRDGSLVWIKAPWKQGQVLGKEAGTVNASGYRVITFEGKKLHAHRIVWVWHGNDLPEQIDHVNGDKLDNRVENLRAANVVTNAFNMKLRSDSKSGVKNVSWCNTYNKWVVQLIAHGKKVTGRFREFEEAVSFANAKRAEMHGEFACEGAR